jgi:predicted transcriptional regulator of viral defense system
VRADARNTRRVLTALKLAQGQASVWEVAQLAEIPEKQAGITLARLEVVGKVTRTKYGVYVTTNRRAA